MCAGCRWQSSWVRSLVPDDVRTRQLPTVTEAMHFLRTSPCAWHLHSRKEERSMKTRNQSDGRTRSFLVSFCSAATIATVVDCLSIIPFPVLFSHSCHPWTLSHVVHVNSQCQPQQQHRKQTDLFFLFSSSNPSNLFDSSPTPISRVKHAGTDDE